MGEVEFPAPGGMGVTFEFKRRVSHPIREWRRRTWWGRVKQVFLFPSDVALSILSIAIILIIVAMGFAVLGLGAAVAKSYRWLRAVWPDTYREPASESDSVGDSDG